MSEWEQYTSSFNQPEKETAVLDYPSDLYRFDRIANGVRRFEDVGEKELQQFDELGYLVIHEAFSSREIGDALAGMLDLIDGKNPEYKGVHFEAAVQNNLNAYSREQKQDAVRKIASFVNFDERLKRLSENPWLIGLLCRLMKDRPVLFQDMGLIKPPRIGREKPWHQDCAYFDIKPGTAVVGAWIAFDEATPENGCMHIIPGSHREGPLTHFARRDWQLCDLRVESGRDVMVPLKPGGVLLFHGLLHHGTPKNYSAQRRRAVQYHYKPVSCVNISHEERLGIYGKEGKNVEC